MRLRDNTSLLSMASLFFLLSITANSEDVVCRKDIEPPRVVVSLFRYAGSTHGDDVKNFFDRLQLSLQRELEKISADVPYPQFGSVDLTQLRVFFAGEYKLRDLASLARYASRDGVLEVLRGEVEHVGQQHVATSYVYLGDRKGYLPRPEIVISLPINADHYANTKDGFALVALYALAIDAHLRECSRPTVKGLLDAAQYKLETIEARGRENLATFESVKGAVESLDRELSQQP